MNRPIKPELITQIIELRRGGFKYKDIAKELSIAETQANWVVNRYAPDLRLQRRLGQHGKHYQKKPPPDHPAPRTKAVYWESSIPLPSKARLMAGR